MRTVPSRIIIYKSHYVSEGVGHDPSFVAPEYIEQDARYRGDEVIAKGEEVIDYESEYVSDSSGVGIGVVAVREYLLGYVVSDDGRGPRFGGEERGSTLPHVQLLLYGDLERGSENGNQERPKPLERRK